MIELKNYDTYLKLRELYYRLFVRYTPYKKYDPRRYLRFKKYRTAIPFWYEDVWKADLSDPFSVNFYTKEVTCTLREYYRNLNR